MFGMPSYKESVGGDLVGKWLKWSSEYVLGQD